MCQIVTSIQYTVEVVPRNESEMCSWCRCWCRYWLVILASSEAWCDICVLWCCSWWHMELLWLSNCCRMAWLRFCAMLFIVYIRCHQWSVSLMLSTLILSTCSAQLHVSHSGTFTCFVIVSHHFLFVLVCYRWIF